ncbi:LysR family transcriptional regulator [Pseudoalteromonas phenolica]|uniref:LysR family transcriptional regulator n=1 Tax=Pseudoalteromonas phenolica TaxID=161398 RepID=A0A4Q7ISI2_9GAMM|nr:LysR family transcriptional regulator [Pseudoalteromonas phenolica]RZQ54981.1 LysR family transcriptional regulator [Pseudoalteromonas phenolica]
MTINKLFEGIEVFVEVVKRGSFASAAQQLGHSNSHISKEMNKLEARLGVRLLNRTTRSLALTPEGEAYYQQCIQLISDAQDAFNLVTQGDDTPKGNLKLSCPIGLYRSHIQSILVKFLKLYPNVTLDLDLSDKRVDLVADGFDLVIRATPALDESSLICKKVYACPTYVVASKSYIEQYGQPYHPKELNNHHCIGYSNHKNPGKWTFMPVEGEKFIVDVRLKALCNNGEAETALVEAGIGITRLPEFYLSRGIASGNLQILFEEYQQPTVNVYAVYPSRKHLSSKVRRFIDMLSNELLD